jgi:hypothetical protein
VYPWDFKGSTRQTGVKPGSGYKSYIQNHMKDGPLGEVEHRAFLNMWLCRFIFCGKANEPTLNHIVMASQLAGGKRIPLGKYLLGSVYHMLHQTISQMRTGQKILCVNSPGGLCRCGCNCTCTRLSILISTIEGEVQVTRGCQTYGEAASTVSINQNVSQLFKLFFRGFPDPLWLPYLDNDNLTLPCEFSFEAGRQDGRFVEIFNIFIHPCPLPAEFCGGRLNHSTYEYYQPNMMARQLGCGQMPPRLFLHEFLEPREEIMDSIQARRVFEYECSPTLAQLMARYATMDPNLSSASADKRKGLSLIAPPAAKRKRTSKKVSVELRFPLS